MPSHCLAPSAFIACITFVTAVANGQTNHAIPERTFAVIVDSTPVRSTLAKRGVIYAHELRIPATPPAPWLRLKFDSIELGKTPFGGTQTILRITSLLDGAVQTMNAMHLRQWQNTSAYFNGDAVRIEIIADPNAPPSQLSIREVIIGMTEPAEGGIATACGPDDRVLSSDPRAARIVPVGCTAWIIDDPNHCFLTAGHCAGANMTTVEFNVPLSLSNGNIVHPGPQDQYAVDPASVQFTNGGLGNDYSYFGCFPNTNTNLTPFQAQQANYVLARTAPAVSSQTFRITGYGVDSTPSLNNQVQQTSAGPYSSLSGNTIRYQVDTEGGNSGSAVLDESTNLAIGIHTHGGCNSTGGANGGSAVHLPGLQNALANPQGVCIPLPKLLFTYPDGLPEMVDPKGDSIRVVVSGANGETPQPGSGMLHYRTGGTFIAAAMTEVTSNVYDAAIPAIDCPDQLRFYFSATTTNAETVTDPRTAPASSYDALVATGTTLALLDEIEGAISGWTVVNDASLTSGAWQQAVPIGTTNSGAQAAPSADHTTNPANTCFVTQNGLAGGAVGTADLDGGPTTLISPTFDLSGSDAVVTYARWFYTNAANDFFTTSISNNNGGSWTEVSNITQTTTNGSTATAWQVTSFVVSDFVSPTSQMKVRFAAADAGAANIAEAGLDDFRIDRIDCAPRPPNCLGDVTSNGTVDVDDLLMVINSWGRCAPPPSICPADIAPPNGNAIVNVDDLLAVINAWGPCP